MTSWTVPGQQNVAKPPIFIPRYAVITTCDRPQYTLEAIRTIQDQADTILVIDNGDNIPMPEDDETSAWTPYYVLRVPGKPVNLSMLWNIGLEWFRVEHAKGAGKPVPCWDVAVLNDDTLVPRLWFENLGKAMREQGAQAACTGPRTVLHKTPGAVDLSTRMTGWGFMLRGEANLRADPNLHWWFGDDDLDWQARQGGGMLMLEGEPVQNLLPNGFMTPEHHVRSNVDAQYFLKKWGQMPW